MRTDPPRELAPMSPCPFCGGGANHCRFNGESWVACEVCGASTKMFSKAGDAIGAWNNRRASEALAALREEGEQGRESLTPCPECEAVSAAIGGPEFMDPPDGGDVSLSEQVRRMRAALSPKEQGRVPEGWRLVPVPATQDMADAGRRAIEALAADPPPLYSREDDADAAWEAMIAASPAPPIPEAEGWRNIESAPKDGTSLIAYVPGFGMGAFVLLWMDGGWREPAHFNRLKVEPTHWQPMPAPPASLNAKGE